MAETWVFNEIPSLGSATVWDVNFVSNGQVFTRLTRTSANIRYSGETTIVAYVQKTEAWADEKYRTITFDSAPSGTLLECLNATAVKSPIKFINRVDLNGETVLDLTGDTVTPETLDAGVTAHNAAGEAIVGTGARIDTVNDKGPDDSGNVEIAAADVPYTPGSTSTVKSVLDGKQTATQSLTNEAALADGDYFPFYDTSASINRKTLWSNIVAKIRTAFFGTLNGFLKANGSGTLSAVATVPVANGGTGSTTAAAARAALGVTPANIGALPLTGGTMTGALNSTANANYPVSAKRAGDVGVRVENTSKKVAAALEVSSSYAGLHIGGKWLIGTDGTSTQIDRLPYRHIYVGTGAPSASTGVNGDIYIQYTS